MANNLVFDILANDKASAKVKGFGDEVERTSGRFDGIKNALGAVGAAIAVTFAADKIVDFGKDVIHSASELQDSTAAAGVIFGDSMAGIIASSKTAAAQFGLSSQQVINAANTFGTYGKSAGLAGDDLAGFSTKMTGLAGDLASFKGTTTEQAIEAIGSALRGEAEPIRAYGVLLDDATLKNRAMAMGLIATTKDALSPANKVLAAQQEILAQTGDAQGDFARTSDSAANTQHALEAKVENLKASLGERLLPAWTAILGVGSKVADFFGDKMLPLFDKVGAGASAMFDLLFKGDFTGKFREIFGQDEDSGLVDFLFKVRETAIEAFGKARDAAMQFSGWITGTLVPGIKDLVAWGQKNKDWLLPMAVAFGTIVAAIKVYNTVMAVWRGIMIVSTAVQAAFNAVMAANPIGIIVLAIAGLVAGLVYFFTQTETGKKIWAAFTEALSAGWELVKNAFKVGYEAVSHFLGAVWDVIKMVWNYSPYGLIINNWNKIIDFFKGVPGMIGDALKGVANVLTLPFRTAFNAIATLWNATLGGFSFKVPDWIPGVGGKGFTIPDMPHISAFANGTAFAPGGLALVGERGPELVDLPRGSKVYPNGTGPGGNTFNIYEAVSAEATAMQVARRQNALGA